MSEQAAALRYNEREIEEMDTQDHGDARPAGAL